jgi:hypothetical protein
MVRSRRVRHAGGLLLLAACESTFLPLRGKFEVGQDPMVVFVGGDGPAGGDLYAVPTSGGRAIPITFSTVGEMRPALSPDGGAVAFLRAVLRAGSLTDSAPASVWILNLINGAERQVELPDGAGPPEQAGWTDGGRALVMRAGGRLYRAEAPPAEGVARLVPVPRRASAESALAVLLGRPAFGRAVPCANAEDLCVVGDTGSPVLFARGAREPARWGNDSVAYLEGDRLMVRPLAAGRARQVEWSALPPRPRQLSVFAGATDEPR